MERLIKIGAEANIYLSLWHGLEVIRKVRRPKPYWREELDLKIRRIRTIRETYYINLVKKFGVLTPIIYFSDPFKGEIVMEYINGERIKDIVENDIKRCYDLFYELGRKLATMHTHNIIHGDPTTSNFIVKEDKLYAIDFGLTFYSQRIEDKAVDIHLLKQVIKSAHPKYFEEIFGKVIVGYSSVYTLASKILENVKEIEKRGRYATF
ncbi:MAG: KEOPS complex kinase/ATPase Bud32 [Nitrososphaeria archaeon]|nr:KEOPS complex kinase/ATPase Bud32 [Nitrososphaeria archaeon]